MPPFRIYNRVSDVKPGASVLATVKTTGDEGDGASPSSPGELPALVTQRFGKGRTAALLIGDMWRWALHRQEGGPEDLPQMWRQTLRWLVADVPRRVHIEAKPAARAGGPVSLEVLVRDAAYEPQDNATVELTVITPGGERPELTAESSGGQAGWYTTEYMPREEGGYRVKAVVTTPDGEKFESREAGWASQPAADELRHVNTNRRLLEEIARQTGGEIVHARELDKFVRGLPHRKVQITENWTYPLWHQPWVMLLAIACLCGEWGLRRWRGLP
jgi:hypothetical protein